MHENASFRRAHVPRHIIIYNIYFIRIHLLAYLYKPTEGVGGRAIVGTKARGERLHVVAAVWVLPTGHVKQVGQLALRHFEQTARVTSLCRV